MSKSIRDLSNEELHDLIDEIDAILDEREKLKAELDESENVQAWVRMYTCVNCGNPILKDADGCWVHYNSMKAECEQEDEVIKPIEVNMENIFPWLKGFNE